MRTAALIAFLLLPAPAFAGGVAPLVTGGFHTENVAYYSSQTSEGVKIPDQANYPAYKQTEYIGDVGSGLELVIGDRDDLIQGVFRGYWMMDLPQHVPNPREGEVVDPSALVSTPRDSIKHMGIGTVGIQWGVVRAANNKFRFALGVNVGAAFASKDHTEFLLAQAGGNVNYAVTRTVEVFADVDYGLRVHKTLSHGLYATAGVRILFD